MYEKQLRKTGSAIATIWLWHLAVLSYLNTMSSETLILAFSGNLFRVIASCALQFFNHLTPGPAAKEKYKMFLKLGLNYEIVKCLGVCLLTAIGLTETHWKFTLPWFL